VLITKRTGARHHSDCQERYALPRTRQARSSRRNAKDSACLPAMTTVQLCWPLAKEPDTPKIAESIPVTIVPHEAGNMVCLKLPQKDPPQKIPDLLAEMIACNSDAPFRQFALSLEKGKVEEPWSRDPLPKPNLPPSERGKIMSRHSSKQSLSSRHSSKEEARKELSSPASSSSHAPLPTRSAQMCAVAAAAEAELSAVKARQESSSEQGPGVLLQLGSQAASAASRLRSCRHRFPHPPLHLPQPMRMQLKPAVAPKVQEFTDLDLESFDRRGSTQDADLLRGSRRAAEISLHVPNPLSASSLKRLGKQQHDEDDEDVGSSDEESCVPPPERRPSHMLSDAFELPFDARSSNGVMPRRAVPNLLKKTRREQEEVAEALHDLEKNLDGVQKSARRQWTAKGTTNHRLALPGAAGAVPRHQHRLSVMLGLNEDVQFDVLRGSTLRVNSTTTRSSTDVPEMLRKTELLIEEAEGKSPSILESITLHSDRDERLERLRKLTTLHRSSSRRHWDGVTQADRERFQEVFQRYDYNRSGGLDIVEMHDALADLGLKPSTRKEKMEMARLAANQDCQEFDFKQFCRIVLQRRKRALEAHRSQLKRLFAQYDIDNSGTLNADELVEVFNSLNVCAHEEDERIAFLDAVIECDINGSGEIEWEEFEPLVQRVREKLGQCHREREVRMREQMKLPPDIFLNFRSQLISFHEAFRQFEQAGKAMPGQAAIHVRHVGELAVHLGISRDQAGFLEAWECDEELRDLLDNRDFIDFAIFLQVAQRLRVLREGRNGQSLRTIFDMYDIDNSGDISVDELYRLMRDLGFEIKASLKGEIRRLFEECDIDGSGLIEFREFPQLFHGVCEMLHLRQHNEESVAAGDLGFSDSELRDLREVFEMLDIDNAGSLKFDDVRTALSLMGEKMVSTDTLRKYDRFNFGRLDFINFLKAMKDVKPTLATATECKRHAFTIPTLKRRSSQQSGGSDSSLGGFGAQE